MKYAWFAWSLAILFIWLVFYFSSKRRETRREMLKVSFWTSFLGLTEPFFVPEYWNPASLFDLAQRTGFDIESIIFAFAVGGIAFVAYERIFQTRHVAMTAGERSDPRHKLHFLAMTSTPIIFLLFIILSDFNPIYSAIISLAAGGIFIGLCRPDLFKKMSASAFIFLAIYFIYFLFFDFSVSKLRRSNLESKRAFRNSCFGNSVGRAGFCRYVWIFMVWGLRTLYLEKNCQRGLT